MKDKKTRLGINRKIVDTFHNLILIVMLHSSFVAPSQNLISAYFSKSKPNTYIGSSNLQNESYQHSTGDKINHTGFLNKKNKTAINNLTENFIISASSNFKIESDIQSGVIGVSNNNPLDDATDNLFKFTIDNLPHNTAKVYLKYDLYGVQDLNAVSRSINERPATGGYLVKIQNAWTSQKEELNINWLQQGENKVIFSIPKNANFQYQVKNVKLEFEMETKFSTSLVLQTAPVNYSKDNKLYIKGFIRNSNTSTKVLAEQTTLNFLNGEFEGFINLTKEIKERKFIFINAYDEKGIIGQQIINLDNVVEADKIFEIEKSYPTVVSTFKAKTAGTLATEGAKLIINDSALITDKEISITKLRSVDIAPLGSGMVNVTKGGSAYRFLPDGTTFKKPVQIALEYDENLLPKGHSANEIKTFYFNTNSKKWIAIERDSIDKQNKSILSSTTHFTDYVNGIIQTPESPETDGFTPTMMSDIKAVDPSSEMTLITPPQVSQKGEANVSYPIKIPAGRNGLQPQLAIQYSSDGGNGWLGEGWGFSSPSISIDTKWGTPTFDSVNESEIYMLNGEQLMYPKLNGRDWMPNRHYDVNAAPTGTFSTQNINRSANLHFTPRKQGGFTNIERIGNSTSNYVWKVINTDGSVFWYGGKNVVNPNSVIMNSTGNIVHWGLFMIEDIHGNSIKYEYNNFTITGQTGQNLNLNGGIVFNIKNIKYNGFNDANYKYEVVFNLNNSIRDDASINARLGVKQVDPYFLSNIEVKKIGVSNSIRKYLLNISYGKFNKGQLKSISELDGDNNLFYEHKFDYYDDISLNGSDVYFSEGIEETICLEDEIVPCVDTDNDGVCDDKDECPNTPGSLDNNGCPKTGDKCFSIKFSKNLILSECFIDGVEVKINGVYLLGGPFYNINDIMTAMQSQHPTSSYNNYTLTISNTSQNYTTFSMYSDDILCANLTFTPCIRILPKTPKDYKKYFTTLSQLNSFTLNNSLLNDSPCKDNLINDEFLISGYIPSFDSSSSLLGSTKSQSMSTGFYIGIGVGKNRFTKMTTFGVQWNWANDKSIALTSLIDINGDGLDDIVSKEGDNLFYKKHILSRTYNENGEPLVTHSFESKRPILGINNFYRAFGRSRSSNFQITFGFKKAGGFLGWDKSKNNSETDMFFTDGNGDGLIDIVRDGVVYFNRIDTNGNPNFIPDSKETENLVITAEPAGVGIPDEYFEDELQLPKFDVVKVWEAPMDGFIKIDNNILLTDTTKDAVVSVEMKKQVINLNNCYKLDIHFNPSHFNQLQNKRYLYTGSIGGLSYKSINNCITTPYKFNTLYANNTTYSAPNNLYLTNYNNNSITNLCPNIVNPNFSLATKTWLQSGPFQQYLDSDSDFTITNQSYYNFQNGIHTNYFLGRYEFKSNVLINYPIGFACDFNGSNIPMQTGDSNVTAGGGYRIIYGDSPFPFYLNGSLIQNDFPGLFSNLSTWEALGPILFSYFQPQGLTQISTNGGSNIGGIQNQEFYQSYVLMYPTSVPQSISIHGLTFNFVPINCGNSKTSDYLAGNYKFFKDENVWKNQKGQILDQEFLNFFPKNFINNNNDLTIIVDTADNLLERTVNPVNCNPTADELCLLYGTQLNASNSSVTNTLTNNCIGQTLSVKKGDRIYFRVHSVENGNSPIDWDPKIEYTNPQYATVTDANGHKPFSSSYSDSFVLSGKNPVTFPGNSGTANISWTPFTITPTDKVTYQIVKQIVGVNQSNSDNLPTVISSQIIYSKDCNPNITTTVSPVGLNNISISQQTSYESNLQQTFFYFKVISSSNIDWKNAVWKPEIEFNTTTSISPNEDGSNPEGNLNSITKVYPVPDYDLYRIFPCGVPFNKKNISTINNGQNLTILPNLNGVFSSSDNGKVNFVVKRGNNFVGSRVFTITNGSVSINNSTAISLGNSGANEIEIMFTADDSDNDNSSESLLKKIALTGNILAKISYGTTNVNVPSAEITLYQKTDPSFGNFFRQWGQFMYNPANVTGAISTGIAGTKLIKEESLGVNSLTQSQANQLNSDLSAINDNMTATDLANFQANHQSYIDNLAFLIANPSRELVDGTVTDKWIGFHKENYTSEFGYRAASLQQSIMDFEEGYQNIEQAVLATGAYAISKYAKGKSDNNFSGGATAFGVGVNANITNNGMSNMLTDYVDYNGDRYPDIVSTNKIQYTNKTGGLYIPSNRISQNVSTSSSDGFGFGASGSFGKNSDDGGDKSGKKFGFERFDGFRGNSGAGFSGNFSNGNSITQRYWTDINGDGLSDLLVTNSGGTNVTLNFGPTTTNSTTNDWGNLPLFNSKSNAVSGGLGVNKWNGSVEAGISLTSSWNKTTNTLIDINGDGLLDMIYADDELGVKLNLGNKFIDKGIWSTNYNLKKESNSVAASLNFGFTFAFTWKLWFITFKIPALNWNGTPLSTTTNKTLKSITDYDGDGFADLVEQVRPNKVKIYHSRIRRTDKLKSVSNPLGGKFTIDYKVQQVDYDNPHAKWTMSQIIVEDGYDKVNDGVDVYKKNFVYEKGKYDRREREFYGYKTIKVEDYVADDSGNDIIYRTNVTNYHNQSYFLNGLVENSYIIKGNDENMKFSKTINHYEIFGLNATNDQINLATVLPATYDVGGTEGRRSAIVLLKTSITELYELNPSPQIVTEVSMKYDTKGRIIEYLNSGNINDTSDDYTSEIEYHNSMNALNIINVPKSIRVSTPSLGLVRERTTDVDSSNGNIVKIRANNNGNWAETDMEYDQYGNLIQIVYPQNTAGESMSYEYTYDSNYSKYVIQIKDAFGYSSFATYDSNFDKPLEVTDYTGNKMIYEYDNFGRSSKIIAPKEILAAKPYTIKFEYYPYFSLLPSGSGVTFDPANPSNSTFVPVAVTSHYDQQNPTNDIETYTFIDGMARPIQVKKDIYYNTGSAASPTFIEALTISGKTKTDELGRTIEQFHPYWEPLENNTKFLLNEYDSPYKSTVIYDELDRPIKNIDPEGNESIMEYTIDTDVDGIIAIKTKSDVDQNGSQHIISEIFKDVSGRVISTNNIGGTTGNIWTRFKYNEIGELLQYMDDEGIATTYKYDMFGRKIEVNHPDNGKTTYKYDNVNLVSLQTANLENQAASINYEYEINRLTKIKYPDLPSGATNFANVNYVYGNSGNETGRLIYQEDATGTQQMAYGNMGELISNKRTIVGPNIPTRQFVTNFEYDSWNRLQTIIYPDGEKITYKYDLGGNLTQMTGELNSGSYDYIKRIDYDYFEQRTYLLYGNKTETFYDYTPSLRRLNNLNVKTSDGNDLFNNNYEFDKIGNVTSLINSAGVTANDMAGKYSHKFDYDNLNRLISAEGSFEGSTNQLNLGNDANSNYTLIMEYNNTHGIANKKQEHFKNGTAFIPNIYDNTYNYISNTHKVEKIVNNTTGETETFKYDANGNITVRNDNNSNRELYWDESNRLRVVSDNHSMQHYIYDGSGERVLKANSDMEAVYENGELVNAPGSVSINGYTSYPSAFMVITADGVYSKHYYAGMQRIVSRLGDNDASIFETGCSTCKQESPTPFDDSKLKQAQIQELNLFAEKAKKGKVTFKEYKPVSLEEQEKAMAAEEQDNNEIERAPSITPIYYYHPDHLGTSTALTDFNGNAYQFFLNLPFGETMSQQLGSNYYNSPYKFNGKELDEETGFYYYGARYYDPKISLWLSVDPLAEKYPSWSPYCYTMDNPINFIDPDGRAVAAPPRNGIAQFIDNSGVYFWNAGKKSYEHYAYTDSSRQSYSFSGYYKVTSSSRIVGQATVIQNVQGEHTVTEPSFTEKLGNFGREMDAKVRSMEGNGTVKGAGFKLAGEVGINAYSIAFDIGTYSSRENTVGVYSKFSVNTKEFDLSGGTNNGAGSAGSAMLSFVPKLDIGASMYVNTQKSLDMSLNSSTTNSVQGQYGAFRIGGNNGGEYNIGFGFGTGIFKNSTLPAFNPNTGINANSTTSKPINFLTGASKEINLNN